jgi:flagellar assembly protein FliH
MELTTMFSSKSTTDVFQVPISEFQYRQTILPTTAPPPVEEEPKEPQVNLPESVYYMQLSAERAQAIAETEARLRQNYEELLQVQHSRISTAITKFERDRKDYFSRVEAEVVQLALAIAKKIIHREAQVDPTLVAAIVQIALGQLKEGSVASLRVQPREVGRWSEYFAAQSLDLSITVVGDSELMPADCVLETELGSVNFSLDAQLKEVEQGFLDVLAQKPQA